MGGEDRSHTQGQSVSTVAHFRQLLAHDEWANHALIDALRKMPTPPPRALEVISHIQGTQWTWLSRMNTSITPTKVWPGMSLDDCDREFPKLHKAWEELFTSASLDATYPYTNTKGEKFESSIRDTLTHIFLHGHFHRGQIVMQIRQAGGEPPYIDFIEAVRKGYLED
jgi:uncharacterized damage-inducible protein DinB